MQVNHISGAGFLVQVVHVLRDDRHLIVFLQLVNEAVALIGLRCVELSAQHIVEVGHECGVGKPSLVRRNLVDGIVLPQAVVAAERLETRFYGHAGAGKKYYMLHIIIVSGVIP